jgi:hypothetical protein
LPVAAACRIFRPCQLKGNRMRAIISTLLLAGGLLAPGLAEAQDSAINAPRFFDPRVRCHDAPHASASNAEFLGRVSVLPGRICLVRQATPRGADMRLIAVEVLQQPEYGRLTMPNRTSYSYRAPPGEVMDDFMVRLIYEGPDGRVFAPRIRYEVRVGQ